MARYILLSQLARRTGHSRTSLLAWERSGALPARVQHGGRKYFDREALPGWMLDELQHTEPRAKSATADERIAA